MNYIDINTANYQIAAAEHYKYLRYVIKKKLNGKYFTDSKPHPEIKTVQIANKIPSTLKNWLNNEINLRDVLIGSPEKLTQLIGLFQTNKMRSGLERLLDYDMWADFSRNSTYYFYNAYSLATKLDIPTCPYCNRMYTKTVITNKKQKKIIRPTFDHWYPRSIYPLFSLSFYNLIPSCNICNSNVKKDNQLKLDKHFHPYYKSKVKSERLNYSFTYKYKTSKSPTIKIKDKNKFSKESIKAFQLDKIYIAHEDELFDMIRIKQVYSDRYLKILKKQLKNAASDEEIFRLAFGVYLEEKDVHKRPLTKMKRDILHELRIF